MELLIASVRPRLELTGAYPLFIMPMIKTCHAALDPHHMDGNLMMVMTGALALLILPLEIKTFCTKLLRISDTDSDRFVVYVFSELKWATDHETAVS